MEVRFLEVRGEMGRSSGKRERTPGVRSLKGAIASVLRQSAF